MWKPQPRAPQLPPRGKRTARRSREPVVCDRSDSGFKRDLAWRLSLLPLGFLLCTMGFPLLPSEVACDGYMRLRTLSAHPGALLATHLTQIPGTHGAVGGHSARRGLLPPVKAGLLG